MKVSTEIDNNFGYEKITQLVDNIPLKYDMKIKYATIDGLLCIEYTKFIKGQASMT